MKWVILLDQILANKIFVDDDFPEIYNNRGSDYKIRRSTDNYMSSSLCPR